MVIIIWITLTPALQKSSWLILAYNSHFYSARVAMILLSSLIMEEEMEEAQEGQRARPELKQLHKTESVSWKQVIWRQQKDSFHPSCPVSRMMYFPNFPLLLWLLSSGSQLLPVNNFLEVTRSGCSISDETCPGLHILLFAHPVMPGRTGFGLSSVSDVLCENGQIVFSL